MSDNKEPWYKRWWPWLVAAVGGLIAILTAVLTKQVKDGQKVKDEQAKDQKALAERLADKDAVKDAKLGEAKAEAELARSKAETEHKEHLNAIKDKAASDEKKLAASPDAASDALGAALERATKL